MIFNTQMDANEAWALRHTLQNNSEIMLCGTATTTFDQIENADKALFEQFKVHYLIPLTPRDCCTLWNDITVESVTEREIRPIQILTGGNPRLIKIWAQFAGGKSFAEAKEQLVHIVDEYTDYFKGHLEILNPQERKVF